MAVFQKSVIGLQGIFDGVNRVYSPSNPDPVVASKADRAEVAEQIFTLQQSLEQAESVRTPIVTLPDGTSTASVADDTLIFFYTP